ncbi:hypothetical protein DAPPUDRAFT_312664 [Daphnia pulex]|uniref:Uncharacterized protein n=1 Tax=Daphnia pulex TaxID=6669 RepID=E9FZV5_DAPPU|nr:hypothetical protein DAPPUDRAFT_312664 [Daphnia pulex]|eukprot:EFX87195.1 hypothetical protein DAPPUDRAFT_312664 [Daphnia pulex]
MRTITGCDNRDGVKAYPGSALNAYPGKFPCKARHSVILKTTYDKYTLRIASGIEISADESSTTGCWKLKTRPYCSWM